MPIHLSVHGTKLSKTISVSEMMLIVTICSSAIYFYREDPCVA
jgi:hypothetical protein